MPFMDGYDATHNIRQLIYEKDIDQPIVVAVTGHTEHSYVDRAVNSGMNLVLSKPVGK
jgi:CheY-like chemotaxis protein